MTLSLAWIPTFRPPGRAAIRIAAMLAIVAAASEKTLAQTPGLAAPGLAAPVRQESNSGYGWSTAELSPKLAASDQPWESRGSSSLESPADPLIAEDATLSAIPTDDVLRPKARRAPIWQNNPCDLDASDHRARLLPEGILYRAYLAGEKESRFRCVWNEESDDGTIWDVTLGGRAAIFRYGTSGDLRPEGFEIDIEGAGEPRLDLDENHDVDAVDLRFGIPLCYGNRTYQTKLAYYHLSSHLGDEYLLKHPGFDRLNYSRDVFVVGYSYYAAPDVRLYSEAGWAFECDVSEPWEFQFGVDIAPDGPTGARGAPFLAVNGHLREEVNFGGNFVAQTGWAWRRSEGSGMFRAGIQYFNGQSEQFSFYNLSENKFGAALWYDF